MQLLPTNIKQIFTRSPSSVNNCTLFDDLSPAEKQAALVKLAEVASQSDSNTNPKQRRFSWKYFIMAFTGLSFLVCAVIASVALAIDVDTNPSLVAKLRMANTALDRLNLLPDDSDWLFDFTKQEKCESLHHLHSRGRLPSMKP